MEMYTPPCRIFHPYELARSLIADGDIALYRVGPNGKFSNHMISRIGGTPYVHAGMLYKVIRFEKERLILAETVQWIGCRAGPFSGQVEGYPKQWDIYRPLPPFNAEKAVLAIDRGINQKYGYFALWRATLGHTRYISKLITPLPDAPIGSGVPLFCSALVAAACREGGRDPQPNLTDSNTEPGHLADPAFATYQFSILGI